MKAIQIVKPGEVKIAEVATPIPEENEVLIKVKTAGICGSDIGAYKGVNPLVSYPRIIGHEVAGEIVSVPDNEKTLKVGMRVIIEPYVYCGKCYPCSIGHTNCCEKLKVRGVHVDGGMAEYIAHPRHLVLPVPESLPWNLVPMVEPLVIAIHGIAQAKVKAGEHVVITGAGQIGLLAAQYALYLKAIPIIIDPVAERLQLCHEVGITNTINPQNVEVISEIKKITNNRLAEVVIECSGNPCAIRATIDYVAFAGRISLVGYPKDDIPMPTALFTKKELTIYGSRNSVGRFVESVQLIAEGKINVKALITKNINIDSAPETIADIAKNPGNYLKVIVNIS